jgi:hypothetical protein
VRVGILLRDVAFTVLFAAIFVGVPLALGFSGWIFVLTAFLLFVLRHTLLRCPACGKTLWRGRSRHSADGCPGYVTQ